jgi:hypothetical protein
MDYSKVINEDLNETILEKFEERDLVKCNHIRSAIIFLARYALKISKTKGLSYEQSKPVSDLGHAIINLMAQFRA